MNEISYKYTQNPSLPAVITKNGRKIPVWIQQLWEEGEYAEFVRKNGCGHCCTAMALNLHDIRINPHEEFALCRKMWGEPRMGEPLFEDNFLSGTGIAKVLKKHGVSAVAYGVPQGKTKEEANRIYDFLMDGKSVILWFHPSDKLPDNPFSPGDHWIYAVGCAEDGTILIANSSKRAATDKGVQFTDADTIAKVLFEGSAPLDFTWGRYDLKHGGGYVVVG